MMKLEENANWERVTDQFKAGLISKTKAAKMMYVSTETFSRHFERVFGEPASNYHLKVSYGRALGADEDQIRAACENVHSGKVSFSQESKRLKVAGQTLQKYYVEMYGEQALKEYKPPRRQSLCLRKKPDPKPESDAKPKKTRNRGQDEMDLRCQPLKQQVWTPPPEWKAVIAAVNRLEMSHTQAARFMDMTPQLLRKRYQALTGKRLDRLWYHPQLLAERLRQGEPV